MKHIHRMRFWENPKECCGTCKFVSPEDAIIKPGYKAECSNISNGNNGVLKDARNYRCEQYKRRVE